MIVTVSFTKFKTTQKDTIKEINESNADYLHIDLFDGKFVDNIQQLPTELKKILGINKKPLDVHLMAVDPLKYLDFFANQNTEYFTFHYEAVKNIDLVIEQIRATGLKIGLAIMLETKVKDIEPYLDAFDQILVMSVGGGAGGEPFNEIALEKITELKALKELNNYRYLINVDGGINEETVTAVKAAGTDMVVSGSYVCLSENMNEAIDILKQ